MILFIDRAMAQKGPFKRAVLLNLWRNVLLLETDNRRPPLLAVVTATS